ncbi:hypothetical protein QTP70_019388 [Hemibagrus guttatus]|uniref:Uncharacterized protein n=1 Tax=Hemibagrus guttatus TaxID=175788 RepID=A0AAE0UKU0_9TELE|nr:hypothetical protein QTP70_019388 [Hemibagrus guttatus]
MILNKELCPAYYTPSISVKGKYLPSFDSDGVPSDFTVPGSAVTVQETVKNIRDATSGFSSGFNAKSMKASLIEDLAFSCGLVVTLGVSMVMLLLMQCFVSSSLLFCQSEHTVGIYQCYQEYQKNLDSQITLSDLSLQSKLSDYLRVKEILLACLVTLCLLEFLLFVLFVLCLRKGLPVASAMMRECSKDRKTGYPLGYAYVNFHYRDDAERAIDMFNFELLLGRPMRVMWSNWEPTAKTTKGGNIFIRNLDQSIDCTSLFDTFSVYGRIVSCKVVESIGYGYVQYESAKARALAIERLNGKFLNECQITIEYFRSWEERKAEVRKVGVCKAEEPKVEARKAVEPKVEAHKAEQPTVEARKAEEPKVEAPKAVEPKMEARKAVEPQVEARKAVKPKVEARKAKECKLEAREAEEPKVEARKAEECKLEAQKAEEPKVEACKAEEPKVEACSSSQYLGNRKFIKKLDHTINRKYLRNVPPKLCSISPKVRQPVLTPWFKRSTPAVETPSSGDTLQTTEAYASEDVAQIVNTTASQKVQAAESPAPVDTVEVVETAGPESSEEAVETVASEGPVEAVETMASEETVEAVEETVEAVEKAASEGTVEAVETTASEDRVEAVETTAPEDEVEATETSAPEETLEAVETAVPEDNVKAVDTAVSEVTVPATLQDVPKFPPPQKRLTIYMLESADLDDQITMAHDYLLPLVAEIHPTDANQITWMLVQGENNFEIMNMIGDPEHLQAKVDKMDALLRAREAGVKPEILNRIFRDGTKKRKKKNKKRKN